MNYYNEFDPHAAAWLRQLIAEDLIPPGEVDERSISDVGATELSGFTQCHFFAGIGGWPLALALAGWPSDRPVWTGSCPCQPFSVAGKGKGEADERHLWPEFFRLLRERRPDTVFGEQVASPDALRWLDGVCADLEGEGYAVGAVPLGAHSLGAPHQRQRLYWVADSADYPRQRRIPWTALGAVSRRHGECDAGGMADPAGGPGSQHEHEPGSGSRRTQRADNPAVCGGFGLPMAHGLRPGLERHARDGGVGHEPGWIGAQPAGSAAEGGGSGTMGNTPGNEQQRDRKPGTRNGRPQPPRGSGSRCAMGDADQHGCQPGITSSPSAGYGHSPDSAGGGTRCVGDAESERAESGDGWRNSGGGILMEGTAARGHSGDGGLSHWSDFRLILCRDGKFRRIPAEPALFPLADGLPYKLARRRSARAPLLRGAGNAIVPQVAAAFISSFLESIAA